MEHHFTFHEDGTCTVEFKGNQMKMPLSYDQFVAWQTEGKLIQDALPHLTADERKFLMTGITPAEWDKLFKEDDDGVE